MTAWENTFITSEKLISNINALADIAYSQSRRVQQHRLFDESHIIKIRISTAYHIQRPANTQYWPYSAILMLWGHRK